MYLGDVCNTHRVVKPFHIQNWIMLMQVWGTSDDKISDIESQRLKAHQSLFDYQAKLKRFEVKIKKLFVDQGIKCELHKNKDG